MMDASLSSSTDEEEDESVAETKQEASAVAGEETV